MHPSVREVVGDVVDDREVGEPVPAEVNAIPGDGAVKVVTETLVTDTQDTAEMAEVQAFLVDFVNFRRGGCQCGGVGRGLCVGPEALGVGGVVWTSV